jgi:mannose-1-phosphate guanylyltransferase
VWVNTSYLANQVKVFLQTARASHPQLSITSTFEPNLLGTAGTLYALLPQLQKEQDLLLVHADNLSWFDLKAFLKAHETRPHPTEITMMTFKTDTPRSCGIVELDNKNVLQAFHEKVDQPPSNLANGAVYLISPRGLAKIRDMGPLSEFSTKVIPAFLGKIYCWQNTVYHRDIGSPQAYDAAKSDFRVVANQYQLN